MEIQICALLTDVCLDSTIFVLNMEHEPGWIDGYTYVEATTTTNFSYMERELVYIVEFNWKSLNGTF